MNETFLSPIIKITVGRQERWDYITGQVLTRYSHRLVVVEISMNESDYKKYGLAKYVVWVSKLIDVKNINNRNEYTIGYIDPLVTQKFVKDDKGTYGWVNMFPLLSCIVNGSTSVFCEHEIPI